MIILTVIAKDLIISFIMKLKLNPARALASDSSQARFPAALLRG